MASSCENIEILDEASAVQNRTARPWRNAAVVRLGWFTLALAGAHALPHWISAGTAITRLVAERAWEYRTWSSLAREVFRPEIVASFWPPAVGAALVVLGWRELLLAALVTVAWLGFSNMAGLLLILTRQVEIEPVAGISSTAAAVLAALAHLVCLVWSARLGQVVWRARLASRADNTVARASPSRPSAIIGRLGVLGAGLFGLFVATTQAWVLNENVALREPWLLKMMATPDKLQPPNARDRGRYGGYRASAALLELDSAPGLAARGEFVASRRAYVRGLSGLEDLAKRATNPNLYATRRAQGFNNLAWLLATCPDPDLREPNNAVWLARRALELSPKDGNTWNTLGVALYRAGELAEARAALAKAMTLRNGGDAYDWFFLAMIEHRAGNDARAAAWFDKAVKFRLEAMPFDDEMHRFHAEAAALLGQAPPKPPSPPAPVTGKAREPRALLPKGKSLLLR